MRTFNFILIVAIIMIATVFSGTVFAIDTSIDRTKKVSDLNEPGRWYYSQKMTDLDLCIAHQNDEWQIGGDSDDADNRDEDKMKAVLVIIQNETRPRRVEWVVYDRVDEINANRESELQLVV